ncbi:MAG: glycosyltransferase [Deltaproteobacteria bacterium]
MKLSIAIVTYDSGIVKAGCIRHTIQSVLSQATKHPLEILVADNSRSPNMSLFAEFPRDKVMHLSSPINSIPVALNMAAKAASGDMIIFMDDDTIICDDSVIDAIVRLAETSNYGFGARRFWTYPPGLFEKNVALYLEKVRDRDYAWLLDVQRSLLPDRGIERSSGYRDYLNYSFPQNFSFVKRDLFFESGGFDEEFNGDGWHDDYFGYCLYRTDPTGYVCLYDKVDVLHVNHPRGSEGFKAQGRAAENRERYLQLLARDGVARFNISVMFGVPNDPASEVLERLVGVSHEDSFVPDR